MFFFFQESWKHNRAEKELGIQRSERSSTSRLKYMYMYTANLPEPDLYHQLQELDKYQPIATNPV